MKLKVLAILILLGTFFPTPHQASEVLPDLNMGKIQLIGDIKLLMENYISENIIIQSELGLENGLTLVNYSSV